jgi:hypothetical protein
MQLFPTSFLKYELEKGFLQPRGRELSPLAKTITNLPAMGRSHHGSGPSNPNQAFR